LSFACGHRNRHERSSATRAATARPLDRGDESGERERGGVGGDELRLGAPVRARHHERRLGGAARGASAPGGDELRLDGSARGALAPGCARARARPRGLSGDELRSARSGRGG
jgi:hypothetical protein